jgi:hypothetical protein
MLITYRLRMFEDWVLRRICGCKSDEVRGGWRMLSNVKLCNMYCSPYIFGIIKSRRRMRWVWHVTHGRSKKCI